jgi:hypothetical protein
MRNFSWKKNILKGLKTSGVVAPVAQVANPEEIVTNLAVALVTGLVHSIFNWWKNK